MFPIMSDYDNRLISNCYVLHSFFHANYCGEYYLFLRLMIIQNKDYPKKLLRRSKFNARACDIIITEAVMIM